MSAAKPKTKPLQKKQRALTDDAADTLRRESPEFEYYEFDPEIERWVDRNRKRVRVNNNHRVAAEAAANAAIVPDHVKLEVGKRPKTASGETLESRFRPRPAAFPRPPREVITVPTKPVPPLGGKRIQHLNKRLRYKVDGGFVHLPSYIQPVTNRSGTVVAITDLSMMANSSATYPTSLSLNKAGQWVNDFTGQSEAGLSARQRRAMESIAERYVVKEAGGMEYDELKAIVDQGHDEAMKHTKRLYRQDPKLAANGVYSDALHEYMRHHDVQKADVSRLRVPVGVPADLSARLRLQRSVTGTEGWELQRPPPLVDTYAWVSVDDTPIGNSVVEYVQKHRKGQKKTRNPSAKSLSAKNL